MSLVNPKNKRSKGKKVALIIEANNPHARGLLHGIREFMRKESDWSVYLAEDTRLEAHFSFLENWGSDGVIARIGTIATANLVRRMNVPTVDVSAARLIPGIPWFAPDEESIAAMAFDHLVSCGLSNLAFFGIPAFNWSKWRCESFKRIVRKRGLPSVSVYNLRHRANHVQWREEQRKINEWLRSLPRPVGIFACNDACGQQLLEVCRYFHILVPNEVAVISVDNDDLQCDLSYPPLTSIALNTKQTGYLAAMLLDRMMAGAHLECHKYSFEPLGVEKRASTDLVAVQDLCVSQAISFIRRHFRENIKVGDLINIVPLSRRALEMRFQQALKQSPHQVIMRMRIDYMKKRLSESDDKLSAISEEMGCAHSEYLSVFFKKQTGMTPSDYRKQTSRFSRIKIEAV